MESTAIWTPTTPEERLDRLESLEQIRQLAHRYALAVDTRNLDELVGLFVEDVQVGRNRRPGAHEDLVRRVAHACTVGTWLMR